MVESKAEAGELDKGRFFTAQVTHSGFSLSAVESPPDTVFNSKHFRKTRDNK